MAEIDVDAHLEKHFNDIDKDHNGFISLKELDDSFARNGYTLTETELKALHSYMDEDKDGKVSKPEFVSFMKQTLDRGKHEEAIIKRTFKFFDSDKSGRIDIKELGKGLEALGQFVSDSDLQKLMDHIDMDHSGSINYKEFQKLWALLRKNF